MTTVVIESLEDFVFCLAVVEGGTFRAQVNRTFSSASMFREYGSQSEVHGRRFLAGYTTRRPWIGNFCLRKPRVRLLPFNDFG